VAYGEKRGQYWRAKYKGPEGRWLNASTDDFGNKFTTETAAKNYGNDLESAVRGKRFINPRDGKTTIGDFIRGEEIPWIDTLDVSETSDATYRSRLEAQILPRWGDTAFSDYSSLRHRSWMLGLKREHGVNYARSIESVMRMLMDDAVTEKIIGVNPIPVGRARRRGKHAAKPQTDDYVWPTPAQALAVAENARQIRGLTGYVMILTMAYTGMRIGEIAGLQRSCVRLSDDPYGSSIQIDWQGQWLRKKGWTLLPPKYSSYRTLILPPFLAALLRELLDSHESDYAFTTVKGKCLRTDDEFYGQFWHPIVDGRAADPTRRQIRNRQEIPAVKGIATMVPHGTRHGHKVWLDEDGHPRVAVEARMGHRLAGVEGLYSHVTPRMELRIAKSLQARWKASQATSKS
jgi:integrase